MPPLPGPVVPPPLVPPPPPQPASTNASARMSAPSAARSDRFIVIILSSARLGKSAGRWTLERRPTSAVLFYALPGHTELQLVCHVHHGKRCFVMTFRHTMRHRPALLTASGGDDILLAASR